jgi:hypothetical protein
MKHLYLYLLACLPLLMQAQFTYEYNDDSVKIAHLDKDLEFNLDVTNLDANNPQDIRWRIVEIDFVSNEWADYVCDEICYTPSKRFNDFTLSADTVFPIIHHISMEEMHGMGTSTLCFFNKDDSANTVQCLTLTGISTPMIVADTLTVAGTSNEFIEGVVYTVNGGTYTEHSDYQIIDGMRYQMLVIDGTVYYYDYEDGEFVEYMDAEEMEIAGTTYTIIDGMAFTVNGTVYTAIGAYTATKVDGEEVIVIGSDTFELFEGGYVPLGYESFVEKSEFLAQNSPNPLSGQATIKYAFTGNDGVINIHDLTGKLVQFVNLQNKKGTVRLNSELQAGLYFYSLQSDGVVIDTKRMQVLD